MKNLNILIACEESQAVCIEFRKLGFNAYSCDIQECSGGFPEWHLKMDLFEAIEMRQWDCIISFPPCTHLAVSGAAHFAKKQADGRQKEAIAFFMKLANLSIKHLAIENPVGIMSGIYRKPNQIIQPYYFGDDTSKKTCLWLKNLPPLYHNKERNLFDENITHVQPFITEYMHADGKLHKYSRTANKWYKTAEERSKERSKTFPGIATAMATQWGEYLNEKYK